jgi:hypothetical protein
MSESLLSPLLRAAERRVNAHCWPNAPENQGADSHLVSIPANLDTDTDLLLGRAADEIDRLWALAEKRYHSIQRLEGTIENFQKNCEHDWAETLNGPDKVGEHCLICDVDRDYSDDE